MSLHHARPSARALLSDAAFEHKRRALSRGVACVASVERLSDEDSRLVLNALHESGVVVVNAFDGSISRGPALGADGDFAACYYATLERIQTATAAERAAAFLRVLAAERDAIRATERKRKRGATADEDDLDASEAAPVAATPPAAPIAPVAPLAPSYGSTLGGAVTVTMANRAGRAST